MFKKSLKNIVIGRRRNANLAKRTVLQGSSDRENGSRVKARPLVLGRSEIRPSTLAANLRSLERGSLTERCFVGAVFLGMNLVQQ